MPLYNIKNGRFIKKEWRPILCDDYYNIPLSKGMFAKIDKEDLVIISNHSWCLSKGYATNKLGTMHGLILNKPENMDIDHINGNKTDNRKVNLRISTRSDNLRNSKKHKDNTSGFKGVSWAKANQKWHSSIFVNGKNKHLGYFENVRDAADVYKRESLKIHGEFSVFSRSKDVSL